MELKKNPKKDLNRNRGLYFVSGLLLIMLLTYCALEWKSYDQVNQYETAMNVPDDLIEEVPITIFKTPPPPPPPTAPPIIEIAPDDLDVKETPILSTEIDQETEVLAVNDVMVEEVEEEIDYPFSVIEEVPVFPGCEDDADKRACFQKMIGKHIAKNFRYPELQQDIGIQGKVYIKFVIQKDGSIGNVLMRGPDKGLEAEAARIIGKLPKMTPGKQRGKAVRVPFSLPINFVLQQ